MAQSSHNTEIRHPAGAEASLGEILTPAPSCEGEQTVEEITLTRPADAELAASDAQIINKSSKHRSHQGPVPRYVEHSIDDIHVDSRYGSSLWASRVIRRPLLRMNLLNEEGVRLLCRALPIRISVIEGRYYAFGGMLSYELARNCLQLSRQIHVLCYEEVSEREVLDAALVDQIILPALQLVNDQVDSSLIDRLLTVQWLRPEIFMRRSKQKLVEDFGRSPRNFRGKNSSKKSIKKVGDAA